MKSFLKSFRYGQKGFTLIELLVVVAILGVLAAVIIPNVASFIGEGTVESANTEAHNVQTAVIAHMAATNSIDYTGDIDWEGADPEGPDAFLLNVGNLQAIYSFEGGEITGAAAKSGGKWDGNIHWDQGTRTWKEGAATSTPTLP